MPSLPSIRRFESDLQDRYGSYDVSRVAGARRSYGQIAHVPALPFEIAEITASAVSATRNSLPPHMQDRVHIIMCLEGSVEVQHCRQHARLYPGEMTLLDSTAGCVVNVDDNHRSRTVELRREHMATWSVPVEAMAGARIPADTIFSSQIADLVASVVQNPDRASPHGLVVQDILARMLSCCISESRTPLLRPPAQPSELERMAQWVRGALQSDMITPDQLATHFGYSRRNLYRLFARAGHTPNSWLLQIKLEQGRELLAQLGGRDGLIATIAYRCGFSDAAHFSRLFKQKYGLTPMEFRRNAWRN